MKLIVTIPALNEAKTIEAVVHGALTPIDGVDETEVWVIDDASSDDTSLLAEQAGASVIRLQHRMGLGNVFGVALQQARARRADVMVNIDGDGQFCPHDIEKLIKPILDQEADFVTCTRFGDNTDRPQMPWVKYWGNQVVVGMINRICGHGASFTDVSCGFRAFNREAICRLTLFGKFTYTQEVFMDLFRKNMRIAEVPLTVRGERQFGRSRIASNIFRYGLHSGMIMLRGVRDLKPLKFFGTLSGLTFALSLAMGCGLLAWYLWNQRTSPFTSLITVNGIMFMLSVVFLAIGMLADMISRHRHITEELLYLARQSAYGTADHQDQAEVSTRPPGTERPGESNPGPPVVRTGLKIPSLPSGRRDVTKDMPRVSGTSS